MPPISLEELAQKYNLDGEISLAALYDIAGIERTEGEEIDVQTASLKDQED